MQEKSLGSPSDVPIACRLTATDLRDRQQAWLKIGKYITASKPIPGGLSFEFANASGVQESLAELVRLEAECCAWMNFVLTDLTTGFRLAITGMGPDGQRGVRESFAPLTRR